MKKSQQIGGNKSADPFFSKTPSQGLGSRFQTRNTPAFWLLCSYSNVATQHISRFSKKNHLSVCIWSLRNCASCTVKSVVGRPTIQCCDSQAMQKHPPKAILAGGGLVWEKVPRFCISFCVFWHFLRCFPPKMGFFACFVQGIYKHMSPPSGMCGRVDHQKGAPPSFLLFFSPFISHSRQVFCPNSIGKSLFGV